MSSAIQEGVPKTMRERFEAVMGIIDPFYRDHLNGEYAILCHRMSAALCRKRPSPLASGTTQVWACAIIYAVGSAFPASWTTTRWPG